jgi:hypothetical protein
MKNFNLQIECGKCGGTRSEILTEKDATMLKDRTGPIYRRCPHCDRTTRWIEAGDPPVDTQPSPSLSSEKRGWKNESPVMAGQERIATASEREKMDALHSARGKD